MLYSLSSAKEYKKSNIEAVGFGLETMSKFSHNTQQVKLSKMPLDDVRRSRRQTKPIDPDL